MKSFVLGRYLPLDSVIHRLDPRIKVIAMLLGLISIFINAGWIGYGCIALAVIFVALLSKLKLDFLWSSMKPMLMMLLFLLVLNCLTLKTGTPLLTIGTFIIYSDAVFQTFYIATRLVLMIMITTILTVSTKPLDLTLAIEDLLSPFQRFGVPSHIIAMLISIALRFIPDLIEETQRIIKAQESRGVDLNEGTIKEKIMAILSLIVPLFVSAFNRAEDLAFAMEARGYVPTAKRTRYKVLKIRFTDIFFLGCVIALLIVLIGISIWM